MNIIEAKKEAINAIRTYLLKNENGEYIVPINRQRPIVFMGPAGVGKTDIARQIAEELNIGFLSYTITHHTRQSAVGLPKIVTKVYNGEENIVTEYTMSEIIASIYEYIGKTKKHEGILFIDEFNCASETLTATMLQFLQNKTFGMHKVPDGWKIVLAGNPPEYNKSVKELDLVTMDRLRIIPINPDFNSWKEYALSKNIHPSILSYLSQKQSNLCNFTHDKNGKQLVTPRGWEELSHTIWIYSKLNFDINYNVISQFMSHQKIAMEFTNYYELFTKIISNEEIDAILEGNVDEKLKEKLSKSSFDIRCSIIWILTNKLQNITKDFVKTTAICDEIYPLLLDAKKNSDLEVLRKADICSGSKQLINNFLNNSDTFESIFKNIKKEFDNLVSERQNYLNKASSYVTNILNFIKDIYGSNGEMEIFLSNISIDANIAKMLIEAKNKEYLLYNGQFKENYSPINLNKRAKKIS
jgi:ATP-dependent Lon protease